MRACPRCGESSDDRGRFCWSCGAALRQTAAEARETRKVVTVLFCDMVGSTALSDRKDPERVQWIMSRYFGAMRAIIEHHGGTVAKFVGDAVMGVFGTPVLHEDDALRAVRAAAEMQQALDGLNAELERSVDVRVEVRIGINTGKAVVGDVSRSDTMVTGDTVNIASRIETSAGPGEVLLADTTYALTRGAVEAEALPPLAVKGKTEPLLTYRLLEVSPGARGRPPRIGSVFVGRARELTLIRETLARAVRSRSCHLLTVLGHPGVGKSRLVGEAIRDADPAPRILEGACLPYGEGTTFWPLAEIVRAAAHSRTGSLHEQMTSLLVDQASASDVVEGVVDLLEGGGEQRRAEERFWAVRRLLEAIAHQGPLAVVFDDIQWAQATLLDLIEHVADWSRNAPLLVVCIARPELLETRPAWGGGKTNAASMLLEPLSKSESESLIAQRLGALELSAGVRERVLEAAEGYPLFVEEMVSMLVEDEALTPELEPEHVPIPATINLLLASRIDRLPPDEHDVLERAAVEGGVFHRGAVEHLLDADARGDLDAILARLASKELIVSERAELRGQEAFRFRHILIRDAAYEALPKRSRADLHERFAAWLAGATEQETAEEFVGYHLEQAFRYRKELRRLEAADRELAVRAGENLAAAGGRARTRGDGAGAANLLRRAAALYRENGQAPPETLIALGSVLIETGDLHGGDAAFAEATSAASGTGDARLATWAGIERAYLRLQVDPAYSPDELLQAAESAIEVFERLGDDAGVAAAMIRVAAAHWDRCRMATTEEVLERALAPASNAGDRRQMLEILELLGRVLVIGPRPVEEGVRRCRDILELARGEPRLDAWTRSMLAVLEAMRGREDDARRLYRDSQRGLAVLGLILPLSGAHMYAGVAELVLGNPAAAEREFRDGYSTLEEIGERGTLSTMAAFLAHTLALQGRYKEAEQLTVASERAASESDLASQVLWRGARARALAHRGELDAAERLAREAVAMSNAADFTNTRADLLVDLAAVLGEMRPMDANEAVSGALLLYEAKGNVASASRLRDSLRRPLPIGRAEP